MISGCQDARGCTFCQHNSLYCCPTGDNTRVLRPQVTLLGLTEANIVTPLAYPEEADHVLLAMGNGPFSAPKGLFGYSSVVIKGFEDVCSCRRRDSKTVCRGYRYTVDSDTINWQAHPKQECSKHEVAQLANLPKGLAEGGSLLLEVVAQDEKSGVLTCVPVKMKGALQQLLPAWASHCIDAAHASQQGHCCLR